MSPKTIWPWLVAIAALSGPAHAAPMTFDQAQAAAAATAPNVAAASLQADAARSARRAAGSLPDPQLTVSVENVPVTGPMAGRLGSDEMTMARVGLMQEFPSGARRRAEASVARAAIAVAEASVQLEARNARLGAALAWIDLYCAERRLAAIDLILRSLESLWEAAPSAVVSGGSRPAQALAPARMRARLEDLRAELVAAAARARAELTRWTGDPAPAIAGPPPTLSVSAEALRAGLDQQPVLAAYRAAALQADADLDLARATRRPDWSVDVSYGHRDPMFGDMVSVGVRVSLPLFASQRQEPVIRARALDANRVAVEREAARRAMLAALEGDLAEHTMHREQWLRARDQLLPVARAQADLETAGYGAGTAGLGDVLEAFSALADAQLDALEREARFARDVIRINLTYGSDAP